MNRLQTKLESEALPRSRSDLVMIGLAVLVSLLPIYNIFYILATTGDNNLSNDYAFFLPLIDKILLGNYDWGNFFRETFYISHFQPLPILVYLANALLTGWNVYYELFFIGLLSVLRVILTYQALTSFNNKRIKYILMPIIAMLIFSNSQISAYEFGASAVPLGLTAFGFTLGVWGLARIPKRSTGLLIMVFGGLIASWTAATGVIAWLVFLVGMGLLGFRKPSHYLAWLGSALVINFPYLYFLVIDRQSNTNATLHSLFDPRLIANLIGRPFANGIGGTTDFIPLGEAAGWIGIALGLAGVLIGLAGWRALRGAAAPALMFMAFGFLCAWQTSLFRVMIAPWYTNMVMPYWIGLVGLAFVLLASNTRVDHEQPGWISRKPICWLYFSTVVNLLAGLYLYTNLTYQDKSFYMASRSPVSAACLRSYEWAPTTCERYVFQWPVNRVYLADFAWPLQRHHLNTFSEHQRLSMQGDMALGRVISPEAPNSLGVQWYDGLHGRLASFANYQHLDLRVTPERSVSWVVELPDNLESADLISATGVGMENEAGESADPVIFELYLATQDSPEQLIYSTENNVEGRGWVRFEVSLQQFQGRRLTLRFTVKGGSDAQLTLYKFPQIDLNMQPAGTFQVRPEVRPINTDLSPEAPETGIEDYIFNLERAQVNGLTAVEGSHSTWIVQTDPFFYIPLGTPLALDQFGWVSFRMAASTDIPNRAAEIYFYFEGQSQPARVLIPLLAGEESHTYSYPLRMVDPPGALVAIRLDPILFPATKGDNTIRVEELRLIRSPEFTGFSQ